MFLQYGELRPTSGWDLLANLGHPCKFQRVSRLGSVTARQSSSGRQPNCAALNRGRHLYSAGWPSRWALATFLVFAVFFYTGGRTGMPIGNVVRTHYFKLWSFNSNICCFIRPISLILRILAHSPIFRYYKNIDDMLTFKLGRLTTFLMLLVGCSMHVHRSGYTLHVQLGSLCIG